MQQYNNIFRLIISLLVYKDYLYNNWWFDFDFSEVDVVGVGGMATTILMFGSHNIFIAIAAQASASARAL